MAASNLMQHWTSKIATMPDKAEKTTQPIYRDPYMYASAVGVAGAQKLKKDIVRVEGKLQKWEQSMVPHAERISRGGTSLSSGIKAISEYNRGGRDVSSAKVLGVRAGHIAGYGRNALEKGIRAKDTILKKFLKGYSPHIKSNAEIAEVKKHYMLFSNPKTTDAKLMAHMIEKGIHDMRLSDADKYRAITNNAGVKKFIENIGSGNVPLSKALYQLRGESPQVYEAIRDSIRGGQWAAGEAKILAGDKGRFLSVPKIYNENLTPILKSLKKAVPYITLGGVGYMGYRAADNIIENMDKKAADTVKQDIKDALSVAGGGALAYAGAKHKINKDIAITYGTMPGIGEGHSSPGKAIKKILENDARFKGYNIDTIERNRHGIFVGPGKRYNTIIDTGLGAYIPSDEFDALKYTHGEKIPINVSAKTKVRYLTDVVHPGGGTSGAVAPADIGRSHFITYGPYLDKMRGGKRIKHINAGHNMSPAIDPDVVKTIATHKYDKTSVLDSIAEYVRSSGGDSNDMKKTLEGIEKLKGKKIITISGSGRGDYVYARARQLANELRAAKMGDEYGILALTAGGKGSPMARLVTNRDVVDVGRLPKELFVGAQNISEAHWGSTGTSSMMESIVSGKPQIQQREWGGKFDTSKIDPKTIAGYQERLLKGNKAYSGYDRHIKHVETDVWNKGNKAMMREMPGVAEVDDAKGLLQILKDPRKMEQLASESKNRQSLNYKGYKAQVENMTSKLSRIAKRNVTKDKLIKASLIAGGGALAGIGTINLLKQLKGNSENREK